MILQPHVINKIISCVKIAETVLLAYSDKRLNLFNCDWNVCKLLKNRYSEHPLPQLTKLK